MFQPVSAYPPPASAEDLPQPGKLLDDVEKLNSGTVQDAATGIVSSAGDGKRHVVFSGKEYVVDATENVKDVIGAGNAKKAAKRQFKMRFDKSDVVLQERTMALVAAIGLTKKHLRRLRACFARVDFE